LIFLGFSGCLLHILNHSLFKTLLFYGAGTVYLNTHTRDLEKLGGLAKNLPVTAAFMLCGSLAISALPPFNGFISEFLIYLGLFNGLSLSPIFTPLIMVFTIAGLALAGGLALLCFTKAYGIVFLGRPRDERKTAVQENLLLLIPMGLLAFLCFYLGLFPQQIFRLVVPIAGLFKPTQVFYEYNGFLNIFSAISQLFFGLLLIFILMIGCRFVLLKNKKVVSGPTWACGYSEVNSRMQYTGSSYVSTYLQLINPLLKNTIELKKPEGWFPLTAQFKSACKDIVGYFLINPLVRVVQYLLNIFKWIQTGDIQLYITYGLIFLLLNLIWVMFF
jgi:NADH:ubiquinone oxidoreductase subunit 5 (subunit L)/multisubunit Na+/H+ antiporter MnhA subunit